MTLDYYMEAYKDDQYIVFRLDDEYFGASVKHVESIERFSPITRVPTDKESTIGVINLRGEVIPVVDPKKMLGILDSQSKQNSKSRIIITDISGNKVGILADSAVEVCEIDKKMIQENIKMLKGKNKDFFKGVAQIKDRYVMIIDFEQLLWSES